jgi:plastocyanin
MLTRLSSSLLACCAAALLSGCGGSAGATSSSGTSATTPSTTPQASTHTTATGPSESIKVDTTPKFASPAKGSPARSGLVQIAYRNIAIAPDTVRVKVGSTIEWTNYDSTQANVTSVNGPMRFASKNFGQGGTYELKVSKPGVIHYECTLYPVTMNGTIEVVS